MLRALSLLLAFCLAAWPGTVRASGASFVMSDARGIYILAGDAYHQAYLRSSGGMPSWTPDGGIVFTERNQIWAMYADGGRAHRLGLFPGVALRPHQVGDLVVFMGAPFGGTFGVWLMRADGSSLHLLVGNGSQPMLAPSGGWVAYTVETPALGESPPYHREIWRINTDGSGARPLTFTGDPDYADANAAAISPDEQWVAFFSGGEADDTDPNGADPSRWGYRNIAVIPAEGGKRRTITDCKPLAVDPEAECLAADNPAWSPDGHQLVIDRGGLRADDSGTFVVDIADTRRLHPATRGGGVVPMR